MIAGKIRRREGIFWVGAGIFLGFSAWRTDIGSFREPGPGFIAFAAALFMAAVGLVMIFAGKRALVFNHKDEDAPAFPSVSWRRPLYTMGLLIGYAALLVPIGYLPTTLAILWGLFYDWDKRNWISSFLVSLATTVGSYLFFEKLLGLRFPAGILS